MATISKTAIQIFPEFQDFTEDLFKIYQKFISNYPQHCDFALNNLLVWFGEGKHVQISLLENNLVLKITKTLYANNYKGEWYTILGSSNADLALHKFFAKKPKANLILPDYFVDQIGNKNDWIISEDQANRDYILDISSLIKKRGKAYEDFRHQLSYFHEKHSSNAQIREIDLQTPDESIKLLNSMKKWSVVGLANARNNDSLLIERTAVKRLINLQPILLDKHKCLGLYLDDELEGFSIYHTPLSQQKIGLGNHIKYNASHKRIFDYLIYETAKKLQSEGMELLNAEQDMGISGIRNHKKRLNPVTFLRKYTISPGTIS